MGGHCDAQDLRGSPFPFSRVLPVPTHEPQAGQRQKFPDTERRSLALKQAGAL